MKGLRVPVRLYGKGIYHDTDYLRGAESREEAERIDAELIAKHGNARYGISYVMEEVKPFSATLRFVEAYHRKSAAYVWFETPDGTRWPVFMTDLADIFDNATMIEGLLMPATYEVCKRGANSYGIRKVKDNASNSPNA